MASYRWFKIFNRTEFEALGLPSRTYTVNLQGVGTRDIVATKSNLVGVVFDEVFLALDLNGNPFAMDDRAVYQDELNDVYVGIAVES
jgi:hypothetical protein